MVTMHHPALPLSQTIEVRERAAAHWERCGWKRHDLTVVGEQGPQPWTPPDGIVRNLLDPSTEDTEPDDGDEPAEEQ